VRECACDGIIRRVHEHELRGPASSISHVWKESCRRHRAIEVGDWKSGQQEVSTFVRTSTKSNSGERDIGSERKCSTGYGGVERVLIQEARELPMSRKRHAAAARVCSVRIRKVERDGCCGIIRIGDRETRVDSRVDFGVETASENRKDGRNTCF